MKILVICAENYSINGSLFARTVGSMVFTFRKLGAQVLGFSPYFSKFESEGDYETAGKYTDKLRNLEYAALRHKDDEHGENLLIRFDDYFGRDGIYGDQSEKTYIDNHLRFSFLASAAMNYCAETGFKPDALHIHEWSGTAGALARTVYKDFFAGVPVILTIHNIRYDFHCTARHISKLGLPAEDFNADGYEFWDKISMLKAAILYADKVVFTSKSYLNYLLSTDLPGGMRGFLESCGSKLAGIQSGIDYNIWNLPDSFEEIKEKRKEEFRLELGMEASQAMLMYVNLEHDSNVSAQVISTILANLLNMNLQLAISISQDHSSYGYFISIQEKNRHKMALLPHTKDDKSLLRRLAACDSYFFVSTETPSLEGLFKSAAAGCVSISSRRSPEFALAIKAFKSLDSESAGDSNAFIADSAAPDLVLEQIRLAESVFCKDRSLWNKIARNAKSEAKVSWDETAQNYFSIFENPKGL